MNQKQSLRDSLMEQRKGIRAEQRKLWDRNICNKLQKIILDRNYKSVHSFIPMNEEVNILPLIHFLLKNKIQVVCPKTLKNRVLQHLLLQSVNELEKGVFGTQHPANAEEYDGSYDLILVPGLAFDKQNNRLGYGAGYYDTFLSKHKTAFKMGVCYAIQMIDKVPTEAHDVRLDSVVC